MNAQAEVQKGKAFGEGMFRERMRIVENEKTALQTDVSSPSRIPVSSSTEYK